MKIKIRRYKKGQVLPSNRVTWTWWPVGYLVQWWWWECDECHYATWEFRWKGAMDAALFHLHARHHVRGAWPR